MTKKCFLILLCLSSYISFGQTQEYKLPEKKVYKRAITFAGFEAVFGILRLDYQQYRTEGRFSQGVAVVISREITNSYLDEYTKQRFGVDFNNKFFVNKFKEKPDGYWNYYLNLGLRYQYISFEYDGAIWEKFNEEGIDYYRIVEKTLKPFTHRIGFVPQIGIEIRNDWILLDFSAGFQVFKDNVRQNIQNRDLPLNRWGEDDVHPVIGAKVGILF